MLIARQTLDDDAPPHNRTRRGVSRSVPELIASIEEFLVSYNLDPKPFVWTASANAIIEKVSRCKVILETHH